MAPGPGVESALIIVCPEAERVVGPHRARHDRAAQFGVPAHVTVTFPFQPSLTLDMDDEARLVQAFCSVPAFTLRTSRTGWFDDRVLFVALDDPVPVIALTDAVTRAFPDHPPYGGAFDEVIPHLTVGHDQPRPVLEEAEDQVRDRLPFEQHVDGVELWAGPSTAGEVRRNTWRRLRGFPLG